MEMACNKQKKRWRILASRQGIEDEYIVQAASLADAWARFAGNCSAYAYDGFRIARVDENE